MLKRIIFIALSVLLVQLSLIGQAEQVKTGEENEWIFGGSIGMDISQLILLNPKIGAGENRLAFGGLTKLYAKNKAGKTSIELDGSLQLAVQRLGARTNPFTKNLDLLRLNAKFGYAFREKWHATALYTFESLLLNTYDDLALSKNEGNVLQAKLFSPATLLIAPGLDYKHNENFTLFFAPFALKSILVADDAIASLGVHGNPWTDANTYRNKKEDLGGAVKANFKKVFYEKITLVSELNLFYDYLTAEHGAEFLDVTWISDLGIELYKGFSINLLLDARWDRDIASVLEEGFAPDGLTEFRKWMITETLVFKYNYVIK